MWVLLEHRKKMKVFIEPQKVKLATLIYKTQNDIYQNFMGECIVECKEGVISLNDLYGRFKYWFKYGSPNSVMPSKVDVKEYFDKKWGEADKNKWKGYSVKFDEVPDKQEGGLLAESKEKRIGSPSSVH